MMLGSVALIFLFLEGYTPVDLRKCGR